MIHTERLWRRTSSNGAFEEGLKRQSCDCGHRRAKVPALEWQHGLCWEGAREQTVIPCVHVAWCCSALFRSSVRVICVSTCRSRPQSRTLEHAPDRNLKPRVKPSPQHAMLSDSNIVRCVGTILWWQMYDGGEACEGSLSCYTIADRNNLAVRKSGEVSDA